MGDTVEMVVALDAPPDEAGSAGSLRRDLDASVPLCDVVAAPSDGAREVVVA